MPISTHLCLISGQATPNLTPMLDSAFRPKKVIMLITPSMKQGAEWLKDVLLSKNIKTEFWPIDDAWDIENIQERIEELVKAYPNDICLNATGGTKIMAMAAYFVFYSNNLPVYYLSVRDNKVLWLYHPQNQKDSLTLNPKLTVEILLNAYGFSVQSLEQDPVNKKDREISEQITNKVEQYQNALRELNRLAFSAKGGDLTSEPIVRDSKELRELINLFAEAEHLNYEDHYLEFSSEYSRAFVNGGWLEYHLFAKVVKLQSEGVIQNSAMQVVVQPFKDKGTDNSKNEIDVIFLAKDTLHLIECKTENFQTEKKQQKVDEVLNKLNSLRRLGGLTTKGMLVSYQPIRQADLERAKTLGITTVESGELEDLLEKIREWINQTRSFA